MNAKTKVGPTNKSSGHRDLSQCSDEQLLDTKICDLGVKIAGSALADRIDELCSELDARGIRFRPRFWLSDDWYSPDGIPGVAIPFYLAHSRLIRLERRQMNEAEGSSRVECMKILRHEAGHAIDNAFRLRRRRRYREVFGKVSQPYRDYYRPRPSSKQHVLHLDMWYAQAHPVEDFAETFAVWLKPRSGWRRTYHGWPAMKKLKFVDELMNEIANKKPVVRSRKCVDTARTIDITLREYYRKKRAHYGIGQPNSHASNLHKLFSNDSEYSSNPTAYFFLTKYGPKLRRAIARWTGDYHYPIDQVLKEMRVFARQHKLRLRLSEQETKQEMLVLLSVQTMNYLCGGRHQITL